MTLDSIRNSCDVLTMGSSLAIWYPEAVYVPLGTFQDPSGPLVSDVFDLRIEIEFVLKRKCELCKCDLGLTTMGVR